MEWTREKLIKTYIICANISQEKTARNFYKSFDFELDMPEMVNLKNHFPCVIGILNYNTNKCIKTLMTDMIRRDERWTKIKLPSKPRRKFPREMMVSDNKESWIKKEIIGKVKSEYPYIQQISYTNGCDFNGWRYAKEIEPIKPKENPDFDWDKYEKATLENQI